MDNRWTTFDTESEKASRIEIEPQNPVIQEIGGSQQIRVIAHYPDGSERDVTGEAIVESGNTEVALTDDFGLSARFDEARLHLGSLRRGLCRHNANGDGRSNRL